VPTDAVGVDNNVIQATSILGGTFSELNDPQFPTGVAGFTTDTFVLSSHYIIGAYIDTGSLSQVNDTYTIYLPSQLLHSNVADAAIGSYLVKTSVVPVPAAIWLFGSGLIGLIGVARRKKA
jgi:hypothetical protein